MAILAFVCTCSSSGLRERRGGVAWVGGGGGKKEREGGREGEGEGRDGEKETMVWTDC